MTTLTLAQFNDIAGKLGGQCINSLEDVCASIGVDHGSLDMDDYVEIDSRVFLCSGCGWWFPMDEAVDAKNSELICDGCAEEKNAYS